MVHLRDSLIPANAISGKRITIVSQCDVVAEHMAVEFNGDGESKASIARFNRCASAWLRSDCVNVILGLSEVISLFIHSEGKTKIDARLSLAWSQNNIDNPYRY